jgi:hypothetical protein
MTPAQRDVDELLSGIDALLAEHAHTNSLADLAATTPRDDADETDLTSQGEGRTADAPHVTTSTAGRADRQNPLGVAIVLAAAFWLIVAGVVVELTAPLMSGGQLVLGPVLMLSGALLLARFVTVQLRRNR